MNNGGESAAENEITAGGFGLNDSSSPAPQIARFTVWLDLLDKDMKGLTPKDAADRLIAGDARNSAFNLQALGRLYGSYGAEFEALRKNYKKLEDGIGDYAKWSDMLYAAKSNNSTAAVIEKLSTKKDAARVKLEEMLDSTGFVPADSSVPTYHAKLRSFLASYAWNDAATDRSEILKKIRDELETIKTAAYDFSHLEEGNGIHEFRRKMRWISMEARSLNGMITLKSADSNCPVPDYASVVKESIAKTKYAVLPGSSSEPNPTTLTPCLYVQIAKLVDVVGDIKGKIEVTDNISTEGEALDSVAPADQEAVQKILDTTLANNLFGRLQEELVPSVTTAPAQTSSSGNYALSAAHLNFYAKNKVHEIEINTTQWDALASQEPKGGRCQYHFIGKQYDWFHFEEIIIDGVSFKDIGARKKSWCGSESKTKPSMNISLAKFQKDAKATALNAFGTDSLILNNSVQDASYLRQCFAYRFLEAAGIPAALCNFARVKVNGNDMGLYINIQPIDKKYLQSRFGKNLGNVIEVSYQNFKSEELPEYAADLDSYKDVPDESMADITAVIDTLNASTFELDKLKKVVDLPYFVNFWAAEMALGDWDGLTYNNNNSYLYFPPNGKMRVLPWGKDQILTRTNAEAVRNTYTKNLLAQKLHGQKEVASQVKARVNELLYLYWNEAEMQRDLDASKAVIQPYLLESEKANNSASIQTLETNIANRKTQYGYVQPNPAPSRPAAIVYPVADEAASTTTTVGSNGSSTTPTTTTPTTTTPTTSTPTPTPTTSNPTNTTPTTSTPTNTTPADSTPTTGFAEKKGVKLQNVENSSYCLNTQVIAWVKLTNVYKCKTNSDQTWDVVSLGDGYFKVSNPGSKRCLTLQSSSNKATTTATDCADSKDQAWKVSKASGNFVQFESKRAPGLCLAINRAAVASRTIVLKCDATNKKQLWQLK